MLRDLLRDHVEEEVSSTDVWNAANLNCEGLPPQSNAVSQASPFRSAVPIAFQ